MAKVALLIGVSEYKSGFTSLLGAVKDVDAMQSVLQHEEMGGFTDVTVLKNPQRQDMELAIETLFSGREKDDLVLLYFSGHGIKVESGKLYLATSQTRKTAKGELVITTAVAAHLIHEIMENSRSRQQVIILDCCFSGAFPEGMTAKDDGSINIKTELGKEGRVVLTSSTAVQLSFEQQGSDLSIYTRYLVEGIQTGAADIDNDGEISADELHEYVSKKVQSEMPAMKPEIYAVREGYKIKLAKAALYNPELKYRKEVESYVSQGEFSSIAREILDIRRQELGVIPETAEQIESEALKPYQEYKNKLHKYEQALIKALERERGHTLSKETQKELKTYQQILGLRDENITPLASARLIWSEASGNIPEFQERIVMVHTTNVNCRNFIARAKFYNPYDGAEINWTYGFSFKDNTSDNLNDSQRQGLNLFVSSKNKTCTFVRFNDIRLEEKIPHLNISSNGFNILRLTITEQEAIFFVNDIYLGTFDVSTITKKGSVYLIVQDGISGQIVRYEEFKIWSINE